MEISLENKPHHTTILRARQKYSEVGEEVEARARCRDTAGVIGPAAPLQVMVIVLEEQKSSSAKIIITSFWHYPSHCMKFPNVTKQKVKVVFLSTLLTSSHPVMANARVGKGAVPLAAFTAAFHTFS